MRGIVVVVFAPTCFVVQGGRAAPIVPDGRWSDPALVRLARSGRGVIHIARMKSAVIALLLAAPAHAANPRVEALLGRLTQDEKLELVRGRGAYDDPSIQWKKPPRALGGAGFVPGIPRLGIPDVNQTDAGQGVNPQGGLPWARAATSLPSTLALAASWDPEVARRGGGMIAEEARRYGFNMILAGSMDLTREPRNGRNFEYWGEDPWLAGVMAGASVAGIQSRHVMSTIKHFALNAQETGRTILSAKIAEAAFRESDLLAFEIAIERARPAAIMTSYNRLNDTYTSESAPLLAALKVDWHYSGYVLSDWGGQHSTVAAANAGSDQESASPPSENPPLFGEPLRAALASGTVKQARLDDMVRRIITSMDAVGVLGPTPAPQPIDFAADGAVSRAAAEAGAVLLKNDGALLPLARTLRRIAVIGGRADVGVMSGGGSGQVIGPAGAVRTRHAGEPDEIYHRASPLDAIRKLAPGAAITFASGEDLAAAARAAATADVAIVLADQWTTENEDVADLSLPRGQDALIAAVARANPRTVVVLETGGPVTMPWLAAAPAVLETWYPGTSGGPAIARLLFGEASPQGRLPITFPASEAQLPRPVLDGVPPATPTPRANEAPGAAPKPFTVDYDIEGAAVGYKWHALRGSKPLFPFGHGLTYTRFSYSDLKVTPGPVIEFDVTNSGKRAGVDTPQAYVDGPGGIRLVGWSKQALAPGARGHVRLSVDPRLLARWDVGAHGWRIDAGGRRVRVGASSADLRLEATVRVEARRLAP